MNDCWDLKKSLSSKISSDEIEKLSKELIILGAEVVRISGAGGGGFFYIITNLERKTEISNHLSSLSGRIYNFNFVNQGVVSWRE